MQNEHFAKLYFLQARSYIASQLYLPRAVILVSANISRICPPSSGVSPFCLRQSPTGRDTLTARTLSGVASLCHSLRWCKKNHSAPATSYKFWCLGFASSSPLLLAFRHATSKCLYKNASNRPYVSKNAIFCCIVRKSPDLPADAYLVYVTARCL